MHQTATAAQPRRRKERNITTPDTYPERPHLTSKAPTPSSLEDDRGIASRWRERRAARQQARLVSARNRHALAQWLRRTARDANERNQFRRRNDLLLHYRAASVRTDLLEVAALLEGAHDPDPDCVRAVRELLAIGDSPLYHPGIPAAELRTTLDYIRAGLTSHD